jgi:hypothetical protein
MEWFHIILPEIMDLPGLQAKNIASCQEFWNIKKPKDGGLEYISNTR